MHTSPFTPQVLSHRQRQRAEYDERQLAAREVFPEGYRLWVQTMEVLQAAAHFDRDMPSRTVSMSGETIALFDDYYRAAWGKDTERRRYETDFGTVTVRETPSTPFGVVQYVPKPDFPGGP